MPAQFTRSGVVNVRAKVCDVFPLLCPKKEEDWIPGWECEVIWSKSGYNEDGAIFRTVKPYGTELYWNTLRFDIEEGIVDFLITAPRLFMLRMTIELQENSDGSIRIRFNQVFTSVSEAGNAFLERYKTEDYAGRLKNLETWVREYLEKDSG